MTTKPNYLSLEQMIKEHQAEAPGQPDSGKSVRECAVYAGASIRGDGGFRGGEPDSAHILIVDDDVSFGQMMKCVVARCTGFECSFAGNAQEALRILEERPVDVVVTDIRMPQMSGLELTRIIKERSDSDVIVITGFNNDFTYEEAIGYGADDFIEKPVRPTELVIRLKRVLRERSILTQRRQAEDALMKSETQYRDIFNRAMEGMFQSTPEGKFITANRALSGMLGYDSPEELMTAVSHIPRQLYVREEDCLALLTILGASGSVNRYEARFRRKDGRHIWTSINMMAVRNDAGEILYYEGNVEDISTQKKAEAEREESLERLRKTLGAVVQALAATVETRDPYTAGHQRRVSDLARAIATKMQLPAAQIDGIRIASSIHDIGKISVPTEILSKPRKLTELEYALIKTHSQTGYDILKDIDFPWPIARMVIEHHERINGSGYPQGLRGDELLIESRIVAVSDVVEAIASHRPYRPGYGIETALEEIAGNKGILYDTSAVDACLELFREGRYRLGN